LCARGVGQRSNHNAYGEHNSGGLSIHGSLLLRIAGYRMRSFTLVRRWLDNDDNEQAPHRPVTGNSLSLEFSRSQVARAITTANAKLPMSAAGKFFGAKVGCYSWAVSHFVKNGRPWSAGPGTLNATLNFVRSRIYIDGLT
jgi:hypothetical protein